jgi:8-oxo-dGTP diphosphatase
MGAQDQGTDATQNRWLTIPRALCFVKHDGHILLMKRAAHRRIFPNRYNGVGGHVERSEHPQQAIIREIQEETGLIVSQVRLRGIHHIDTDDTNGIIMFVFVAESNTRDFVDPGIEGTLHWIKESDVLTLDLVEDLAYILPRVLKDSPVYFAHVSYDDDDNIVIRFDE